MKVLYSSVYGSRLFGTDTPNSDWDFKCVVLPSLDELLLGTKIKNMSENTTNNSRKNTADDVDTEFIPLQQFAYDFYMGQSYAIDLAFMVGQNLVGAKLDSPEFGKFCAVLRDQFLTKNVQKLVNYSTHQAMLYSDKGMRLLAWEAIRDLLVKCPNNLRIDTSDELMGYISNLAGEYSDCMKVTEYLASADHLKPCVVINRVTIPYSSRVETALLTVKANIKSYGSRVRQSANNQGADFKALSHAVRIVLSGIDVVENRFITFPYSPDRVKLLREIRSGLHSREYINDALVAPNLRKLETLIEKSDLPDQSPVLKEKQDNLVLSFLKDSYRKETKYWNCL